MFGKCRELSALQTGSQRSGQKRSRNDGLRSREWLSHMACPCWLSPETNRLTEGNGLFFVGFDLEVFAQRRDENRMNMIEH